MLNYCLRLALAKFDGQIRMHEFLFMSNHAHFLLTDVAGVLPSFMQWLGSNVSRNLNAMRGLSGRNLDGYTVQIIERDDHERQLRAAVYILNNPCNANLVARSRHWRSTTSLELQYGQPSDAKRPVDGMYTGTPAHLGAGRSRRSGRAAYSRTKSAAVATLTLHRMPGFPKGTLSNTQLRALVLERLTKAEATQIVVRRRLGLAVLGWRRVVTSGHNDVPHSSRALFDIRPTVAASTQEFRERGERRIREFLSAYYAALEAFVSGAHEIIFPHGTWMMAQVYNLPCHAGAP